MSDNNWSFSQVWNGALAAMPEREIEPRDYMYASELGRGFYDRYHKMHGRKPTTPPNLRARRKFEAGNLTEWVIEQVLKRANVLKDSQQRVYYRDGDIVVSGRCDFIGGGEIGELDESFMEGLPENFINISQVAIARLKEDYPDGMREQGIELKSCARMMFDKYEQEPGLHHALQAYHYARNMEIPYVLEYVSRDDLRMCAWVILPHTEKWEDLYQADIKRMAEVYAMDEEQVANEVKEPLLNWDGKKFSSNFEVQYSMYLTDYDFEDPEEYAKPAKSKATRLNNVIKRIREGKELSKVNLKTIEECCEWFKPARDIITKELERINNANNSLS